MKRANFKRRRDQRRLEAEARQEVYDKLSHQAKVAKAGKKVLGKLEKRQ